MYVYIWLYKNHWGPFWGIHIVTGSIPCISMLGPRRAVWTRICCWACFRPAHNMPDRFGWLNWPTVNWLKIKKTGNRLFPLPMIGWFWPADRDDFASISRWVHVTRSKVTISLWQSNMAGKSTSYFDDFPIYIFIYLFYTYNIYDLINKIEYNKI